MNINPAIFREYDIRGIWGKDLTSEVVQSIGKAFAVYLKKNTGKEKLKITVEKDMSGHIFFADNYFGYDDALYASVRLLEIISKAGSPYALSALLSDIPKTVTTPEIRKECPDEIKFKVIEKMRDAFKGYPVVDIDGMRINFEKGWGLIRASNTQPALVLRFEASDDSSLKEIKDFVESRLQEIFCSV